MEGYIAEIRLFAANFAPRNWAYCQGQIISISQNSALFSLLGTTYGGNGIQTFGLPNFASRVAVGAGQGPGLSLRQLGEIGGTESVTLNVNQIPSHTHTATGSVSPLANTSGGGDNSPASNVPAGAPTNLYAPTKNTSMGITHPTVTVSAAGNNSQHTNIQPSLGMNYIICMYGIYPSRN